MPVDNERAQESEAEAHTIASALENVRLVEYDERFLERSWTWFNDEEILALTMTPPLTSKADQLAWFAGLAKRTDYFVWGIETGDKPIGVTGLKHVKGTAAEAFTVIGDKEYWGRGLSRMIMRVLIGHARNLGIKWISARTLMSNVRSMRSLVSYGFTEWKTEGDVKWMKYGVDDEP
ncbi:MAG: GNAT family N-acetyltransferase [Actinobacteria bacterium]|nr:GNAT family N-acetyltransferase [Actinomycetota bacterium]